MHTYDEDTLADKLMWDSRTERHAQVSALFNINPMVFNHELFYESHRNEIAIMAGKAYENITKSKIMSEQTALKNVYNQYLQGLRSEQNLKEYAGEAIGIVKGLLESDMALVA